MLLGRGSRSSGIRVADVGSRGVFLGVIEGAQRGKREVGEGDEDDTSKPRRTDLVSDVVLRVGSSDQMHVVVLIPGASGQVLEMPGSHQSVVTGQERTSPQG